MAPGRSIASLLLVALVLTGAAVPADAARCRRRCVGAIRSCAAQLGCAALTTRRLRRACRRACRVATVEACRATGDCLFAD